MSAPPAPTSPGEAGGDAWAGRHRNVLALGLVSLFTDVASEMVVPLLPAFLATLGSGALALAWMEGLASVAACLLRLVSGRWADRRGRAKGIVLGGYALSALVRPLFGAVGAAWQVVGVRSLDRVGKGLRGPPRDALLAASVPEEARGRAFGLNRALDHLGAVLGPLLATGLLALGVGLRPLFLLSAVPGLVAVAILALRVEDLPLAAPASTPGEEPAARGSAAPLARFLIALGLVTLGMGSELFLLLRLGRDGVPLLSLPLLWVGLHLVKSLVAWPAGGLADRWGRRTLVALGWTAHAAVYLALAISDDSRVLVGLVLLYGVAPGLSEGAERALVAQLAGPARRGSAFGAYHLVQGLLALPGGLLFATLWERVGPALAFQVGACLAAAGMLGLLTLPARRPAGAPA